MPKYKQGSSCLELMEEGIYPEEYDTFDRDELDEDYREYLGDMESDYGFLEDIDSEDEYYSLLYSN